MCILLATTEHEEYPFILLSNRDEYFNRPTRPALVQNVKNKKIICPCDLAREEHGTWIGVDDSGRIAVLLNYREDGEVSVISEISRGVLPIDYISSDLDDNEWLNNLETSLATRIVKCKAEHDEGPILRRIGGFSLLYGKLTINEGKIDKMNIISNRGDRGTVFDFNRLTKDKLHLSETTIGLSNSVFYEPWEKVKYGSELLHELMDNCKAMTKNELVENLFGILSKETYDKALLDKSFLEQVQGLRSTIFVPPLKTRNGHGNGEVNSVGEGFVGKYYGTRTQTVILLSKHGHLHYYERDLHPSDDLQQPVRNQYFDFKVPQ